MEEMEIYQSVVFLLGGVGVFIIAMRIMSQSLQKIAGSGMKKLLSKNSSNRILGIGIGAIVTSIIQSSSATTVLMIGFLNSESMTLSQAASIIMGSNIGTTATGLIVSLYSLKYSLFFILLVFFGIMISFFKNNTFTNFGGIFSGLGMIFVALTLMDEPFKNEYLKNIYINAFKKLLSPLLMILLGIVFTAVIKYSSAMMGIVIVFVQNEIIRIESALFIVLGLNIGTCINVVINSIGAHINAKRAGIIHLMFNIFGAIVFAIIIFPLQKKMVKFLKIIVSKPAMQISLFHFIFNVFTSILLFPFINLLVKLVCLLIKDDSPIANVNEQNEPRRIRKELKFINNRFLLSPQIAAMQVQKEIKNMALLAKTNYDQGVKQLFSQDGINSDEIISREELIDYINIETTKFLVKLAPKIDEKLADEMATYFHLLNDIERIGNNAINIFEDSKKMKEKNLKFSQPALEDLKEANQVVLRMFSIVNDSFDSITNKVLILIEELNIKIENLQTESNHKHFERLTSGQSSMKAATFFTSAFSHFNSIASLLNNIGHCLDKGSHSKSSIEKVYFPVQEENDKQRIETLDSKNSELNISSEI